MRCCQCIITVTLASQKMNVAVTKERRCMLGPRVIAPVEVAALSGAVTSEPIAAVVDGLFVSVDASIDAGEDQGHFQGE